MTATPYRRALIVGAGPGLGASLARAFTSDCGMRVAVAARRREPLEAIAAETGAAPLVADASNGAAVDDDMSDMDALRRQFARHALREAAQRELAHRERRRLGIALHAR